MNDGGSRGHREIERIYWHILFYEFIELDLIGLGQWKLSTSWQCVPDGQLKALFMCNSPLSPAPPPSLFLPPSGFTHILTFFATQLQLYSSGFQSFATVPRPSECNNWSTLSVETRLEAERGPTRGDLKRATD